eukprot:SAG31_NODE_26795_length_436_cov_1.296736_1_plen_77_part_01
MRPTQINITQKLYSVRSRIFFIGLYDINYIWFLLLFLFISYYIFFLTESDWFLLLFLFISYYIFFLTESDRSFEKKP